MSKSKSRVLLIPCRVDSDWVQPMALLGISREVVNKLLARMERVETLKTEEASAFGIQYRDASIYLIDVATVTEAIFERLAAVQTAFDPDWSCVFDRDSLPSGLLVSAGLADLATCKATITPSDVFWQVYTTGEKRVRTALVSKHLLEQLRASMVTRPKCHIQASSARPVPTVGNYVVFAQEGERIAAFALEQDAKAFKELKEHG